MNVDKVYCMSHYLAFRFIKDETINFYDGLIHNVYRPVNDRVLIKTADEIDLQIKKQIDDFYLPNKTALLLSGGMDSAILASYLPQGTLAFTFKCIAPGAIDETKQAQKYCEKFKLNHKIIEIRWEDFEQLTPEILRYDQVPFHSIEVQLVKAAKIAKQYGIERLIIGESADLIFGGMDKLLQKDWTVNEFYNRYNFVEPKVALRKYISVLDVYEKYRSARDSINFLRFMDEIFSIESSTSYMHAFNKEEIVYLDPYSTMQMATPLDLSRIRHGEPKYLIRVLFAKKYPELPIPDKIPLPRATSQWLKNYKVSRPEFIPNCTDNMTGDQK